MVDFFLFVQCRVIEVLLYCSTEYSTGSDRYAYSSGYHREPSRTMRERTQDIRDPLESIDHHHHYHKHHRESSIKRGQFTRSLSNTEPPHDEKAGM